MPTVIIFNVRNPTLSPGTGRLSHASHDRCVVYYMWWPNAWCSYIARIREISLSKAHQHQAAKCRRQRGLPDGKHVICITYGTKCRIFKKKQQKSFHSLDLHEKRTHRDELYGMRWVYLLVVPSGAHWIYCCCLTIQLTHDHIVFHGTYLIWAINQSECVELVKTYTICWESRRAVGAMYCELRKYTTHAVQMAVKLRSLN